MAVAMGALSRNISRRHLEDTEEISILRQALRGAGYFRLTKYAEKIASYFDREGDLATLREDALFAYALAMPGETTRGRIRGMLRKIDALAELDQTETDLVMFALDETASASRAGAGVCRKKK